MSFSGEKNKDNQSYKDEKKLTSLAKYYILYENRIIHLNRNTLQPALTPYYRQASQLVRAMQGISPKLDI